MEIGTLLYENPAMQNLPDKDAILVISFGTTQKQARNNAIENIINKIRQAYPTVRIAAAFTSHIVIRRIKEKEGLCYNTPEKALELLRQEGYTRIAIVTLDIIPGIEYTYKQKVFLNYKDMFKKMTIAVPLLYWMGQKGHPDDIMDVFQSLLAELAQKIKDYDAVLIFAHGTLHPANAYYSVIQDRLVQMKKKQVYVYTVDGWPNLATVIPKLKENCYKKLLLIPFMIVAGEHVCQDMAGQSADSHRAILEREGFAVDSYLHGLGESATACRFFLARTEQAHSKLIKDAK